MSRADLGLMDQVAVISSAIAAISKSGCQLPRRDAGPRRRSAPTPSTPRPPSGRSGGWSSGGRGRGRPVGEDHLACVRVLVLPGERQVVLIAGRVADFQVAVDRRKVEDGDRDREGQRDRVAQVDQRVQARQRTLFAEPAQQRLGGAAVLGGLAAPSGRTSAATPGSPVARSRPGRPAGTGRPRSTSRSGRWHPARSRRPPARTAPGRGSRARSGRSAGIALIEPSQSVWCGPRR